MLTELMRKCQFRATAKKLDTALLWCLFPLIVIDIIIHGDKWDQFFEETDPLYYDFKEIQSQVK